MQVLELINKFCHNKLPVRPEKKFCSSNYNGEAFSIVGDPFKVIKLAVIYDYYNGFLEQYQKISQAISRIIDQQPQAYVHVYEQKYLGTFAHFKDSQEFILHYYIMDKLEEISPDEQKVFRTILSHEDRSIKKNWSFLKIDQTLLGLSSALDFDVGMVRLFLTEIRGSKIIHHDLHERNIMKDNLGNFKLIDLDSITLEENYVKTHRFSHY